MPKDKETRAFVKADLEKARKIQKLRGRMLSKQWKK